MEWFAEFHFLRPFWLLLLAPLALVLWSLWRPRAAANAWQRICDPNLLRYLLIERGGSDSRWFLWLLALAWLLTVLALAGPTWSKRVQSVHQTLDARVLVLDLSRSMLAQDLKPSRMARARFKIMDLLARTQEG